jgi:hypothetical protein
MRKFLKFMLIGSFFATVEEFLTVVIIRQDIASYLFTLLILFPAFLTFVWVTSPILGKLVAREPLKEITIFFVYGLIGLLIEWFLIGLSPWSDPNANWVLMLVFQLGMFSFWATVAFAPRIFIDTREASQNTRRAILKFYIPYFLIVYLISLLVPEQLKFVMTIVLIILGYLMLNLFYIKYFLRLSEWKVNSGT